MIELKNLAAGYNGRPVFTDVSLEFRPGEVLVLAGPNGCGKSTLLKTVVGIERSLSGEILFDGRPADELSPREIARRAAYMPQERGVPSISVRRMALHGRFPYLSYPRRYRDEDYGIVDAALERADAAELAPRLMPELSGGQRQRLTIARALTGSPNILILDDSASALDFATDAALRRAIRRETKDMTVLIVSQRVSSIRSADRIFVLDEGRLCGIGTHEELLENCGEYREICLSQASGKEGENP